MKKYIKQSFSKSVIGLIGMIQRGEIRKKKAERILKEIDKKFPDNFVESNIKEFKKPYTKDTLDKIRNYCSADPSNKEEILYMADVADEVYKPQRRKKTITIIAIIAIIISIITVFVLKRR